jgi:hypothetical protein
MTDKVALRELLADYKEAIPSRKKDGERIYLAEQKALLALLDGIIAALDD